METRRRPIFSNYAFVGTIWTVAFTVWAFVWNRVISERFPKVNGQFSEEVAVRAGCFSSVEDFP